VSATTLRRPVVRRSPERSALATFCGDVVEYAARMALRTWFVMLGLGAIHHEMWPGVPALGFWHTLLVLWVLDGFLSTPIYYGTKYALRGENQ
jgi:hypothetical protein